MPGREPTPERHSRGRRSHGEDYPGHGDPDSLEDQYAAPEEPNEDEAEGDEEDGPPGGDD